VKLPRPVLKMAAAGSSILLVAGFVSYRAGAFDWLGGSVPQSVEADPAPVADAAPEPVADPPTAVTPLTPPVVLSSSKSAIIVTLPPGGSQTGPVQTHPPIIGGSKSLAPLIPPKSPQSPPASQSPNPPQ